MFRSIIKITYETLAVESDDEVLDLCPNCGEELTDPKPVNKLAQKKSIYCKHCGKNIHFDAGCLFNRRM